MPNEFIARNGITSLGNVVVTGSLTTTGTINMSGSIASASFASSASNAVNAATASSADNFLARGTITAQTIVVQTITSSVDFVTGSTRFGSISGNTHVFTGSMSVSGSGTFIGNIIAGDVIRVSGSGAYFTISDTQASSKNWAIRAGHDAVGDLAIRQSNSTGGDPVSAGTTRLYISPSGNLSLGSTVDSGFKTYIKGDSSGLLLSAGSSSSDNALLIQNAAENTTFLTIKGNGAAAFTNTETTFNYNPQTSLLSGYNYLNFGGGSIMYRNASDLYFGSNAKYGSAGTVVANYTTSQGMGMLTMNGGALNYQANDTSVTAGTAYAVPIRFTINGNGLVSINNVIASSSNYKLGVSGSAYINGSNNKGIFVTDNSTYASIVGLNSAISAYNPIELRASGTDYQLYLATSGNVGIGISTPAGAHMLQINNPTQNYVRMNMTNTSTGTSNSDGLIFQQEIGNSIIKNQENGYFAFGVNGSETNLVIAQGGNVSINSTVANYKFQVNSGINTSSATVMTLQQATNGAVKDAAGFGLAINNGGEATNAADLIISTASGGSLGERMRITSGGSALIGTNSNPLPDNAQPQLGVLAGASTDAVNIKHTANGNNSLNIWQTGTTEHGAIAFYKGDTQTNRGLIRVNTSGTTYTSVSDYRLKENITPLENGLDRVLQLKPSKFNWIETGNETEGFIAHELQEYFPDAVTGEKDAVYSSTGNIKPQSVDYGRITPLLVKAIQELEARVKELENK
jgi:hypothetical protein